jgi:hypothetical protein
VRLCQHLFSRTVYDVNRKMVSNSANTRLFTLTRNKHVHFPYLWSYIQKMKVATVYTTPIGFTE